jgi:hypothetical protein
MAQDESLLFIAKAVNCVLRHGGVTGVCKDVTADCMLPQLPEGNCLGSLHHVQRVTLLHRVTTRCAPYSRIMSGHTSTANSENYYLNIYSVSANSTESYEQLESSLSSGHL